MAFVTKAAVSRRRVGMLILVMGSIASTQAADLPDLTGTYDLATLTPLQRPVAFGNNKYLSREEAEKIRLADQRLEAADNAASDPNREAPQSVGTVRRALQETSADTTPFGLIMAMLPLRLTESSAPQLSRFRRMDAPRN